MSVKQTIQITNRGLSPILSIAQGTGTIEYEFTLSDYDIPSGSAAVAYNIQPTGNIVSKTCSISGNTITVQPPAYFFLRGKNYMQFQISNGGKDLISFLIEVWCAPNIFQPEVVIAQEPSLISQLLSAVGEVEGKEEQNAEQIEQNTSQINGLASRVGTNEQNISVMDSRIDAMQDIPTGSVSTSADAALNDIKIGWDGTTYDTPGEAVRGQIGSLSEESFKTRRGRLPENCNIATDSLQCGSWDIYDIENMNYTNFPDDADLTKAYFLLAINKNLRFLVEDTSGDIWECNKGIWHKLNSDFLKKDNLHDIDLLDNLLDFGLYGIYNIEERNITGLPAEANKNDSYWVLVLKKSANRTFEFLISDIDGKIWIRVQQEWIRVNKEIFNKLKGVHITFIGDSITANTNHALENYVSYFEKNGAVVQNLGVSGTGFKKSTSNNNNYMNRIKQIDSNVELIGICGSFNDIQTNEGQINEWEIGTSNDTTEDTIAGCMNITFDLIQSLHPTTPIVCYTTNYWSYIYSNNEFKNKADLYVSVLKEICEKRSIPFKDLTKQCNLRPWIDENRAFYFKKDGTHPNEKGHMLIFQKLLPFFKESILSEFD